MATLQAQTARQRITELDVARLNVVEPNGQLVEWRGSSSSTPPAPSSTVCRSEVV